MNDTGNALEALKLVSDWAKWLITIEAGAIAVIGGCAIRPDNAASQRFVRILATVAVGSFVVSIAAAAMLLLTLPEIAQNVQPEVNIWLTQASVMGQLLGLNTQSLALGESFFFGFGIICFGAMIVAETWT